MGFKIKAKDFVTPHGISHKVGEYAGGKLFGGEKAKKWSSKIRKYTDPLDIGGSRSEAKKRGIMEEAARSRAFMEKQLKAMPKFQSFMDKGGALPDKYKMKAGEAAQYRTLMPQFQERLDKEGRLEAGIEGMEALRDRAYMDVGEDPWTQQLVARQQMEEVAGQEDLAKRAALGREQQMSQLAARGGLSPAARERMMAQAGRGEMAELQRLKRAGQAERMDILGAGEQRRLQLQQAIPGMELAYAGQEAQRTGMWGQMAQGEQGRRTQVDLANKAAEERARAMNIETRRQELAAGRAHEMGGWQTKMGAYGAGRQADILAKQAPSGGIFGSLFG